MAINVTSTQSSASTIPASIIHAVDFLTRPLILIHTQSRIASLQLLLRTTLSSAYFQSSNPRLTLTLSPVSVPPRTIYAACVSTGIRWAEWITVLGGREFDLLVEPTFVAIRIAGRTLPVWVLPEATEATRPDVKASLRATLNSALARAQSRTLAQQILESEHEEQVADELFAEISNTSIITPTPTRNHFQIPARPASPALSSIDSRPSSRNSDFSDFSYAASEASMTSVSSYAPSPVKVVPSALPTARPCSEFKPAARSVQSRRAPVFVDNSKTEVTKYSYEGGVSTVLTGGVMLGGGASNKKARQPLKSQAAPKRPLRVEGSSWRLAARV